jgi:three-Cys-motif partner protein
LNILAPRTRVGYVDLFAGPGLNKIGDQKVPIPGSPLVPVAVKDTLKKHSFSAFIFSETEEEYAKALATRVKLFPEMTALSQIRTQDANQVVAELPDILKELDIGHCLVFIDPEGLEFKWKSLESLVSHTDCDFIINFPSSGVQRNLQNPDTRNTVQAFLGPGSENIPLGADEEWAIQLYRKNLARIGKDVSTEITIKSGGPFHYHLIPAVKTTYRNSPWFSNIFPRAKQIIERLSGDVLGIIADQIEGKQQRLSLG